MTSGALPATATTTAGRPWIVASLLAISDDVAALMLAGDLLVVCVSVALRYWFNAPVEFGLVLPQPESPRVLAILAKRSERGMVFGADLVANWVNQRVADAVPNTPLKFLDYARTALLTHTATVLDCATSSAATHTRFSCMIRQWWTGSM